MTFSSRFIDKRTGDEVDLTGKTIDEVRPFYLWANRKRYGTACECTTCGGDVHLVKFDDTTFVVRHNPTGRSCAYRELYERIHAYDPTKSHAHIEAQVRLALAVESVGGYDVETEKHFSEGLRIGEAVRVDLWYKHRKTGAEYLDEIQLTKTSYDDLAVRDEQRQQVSPSAVRDWYTPHADDLGDVRGLVVDDECRNVTARAFSRITPDMVPMDPMPSVAEAVKGVLRGELIVVPNRPDADLEVKHILMPKAAASSLPPIEPRAKRRRPVTVIDGECTRPPVMWTPRPDDFDRPRPIASKFPACEICGWPMRVGQARTHKVCADRLASTH